MTNPTSQLYIYHEILDYIIILHGIGFIPAIAYVYSRFFESNFKKMLKWIFLAYTTSYLSLTMRSLKHMFALPDYFLVVDIGLFTIAMAFACITIFKVYLFSKEYTFRAREFSDKLKD